LQGLSQYFFETRTTLLLGEDGNIGLRAEAEYDALLTQKLILTPSIQLSAYTKDNEEMGIGSGFSNITMGTRLRYEVTREFAPYIGVEWNKNLGNTNDISSLDEVYAVVGMRFWF
jgi:copper resistance protein B